MNVKNNTIVNQLKCATLEGITAKPIDVEATFTKGLPGFSVVGLASSDIQEAKERTKSALLINEFKFPPLKITVNLSPSDIRKSGTHLDLAMALLIALNKESIEENIYVFGELGLDGKVKSSSMLFPLLLSLKEQGLLSRAIVPKSAMEALSHIPNVEFIAVDTLQEAIDIFINKQFDSSVKTFEYSGKSVVVQKEEYYFYENYVEDFKDVKGQQVAKRAALIAAAGMHNFFMEGNPGCGKSMIAQRIPHILPPLSKREILSIAKHDFLNVGSANFLPIRPIRSPHHTATSASIFGGGSSKAQIGEVALANNGVLFFDEIPHFSKKILEALREPLQDGKVNISRVNSKVEYSANMMFIAAQNPCPCGNFLSKTKECRCSDIEINRYKGKLSDPFLDRIDIFVGMQEVSSSDISTLSSHNMHEMVLKSFLLQKGRGQESLNGKLLAKDVNKYCKLTNEATNILNSAISKFSLSQRSIVSIKKVSRTIADLNANEFIEKEDILEALSYRRR